MLAIRTIAALLGLSAGFGAARAAQIPPSGGTSAAQRTELAFRRLVEPPCCPPASPMTPTPCGAAQAERRVNEATGEFFERVVDLQIPGRGLDCALVRTYRSRSGPSDGPLGPGWTHSYDVFVDPGGSADAQVVLHDGSGRRDLLARQPDGTYAADELFVEGAWLADGSFELTFPDASRWLFRPTDVPVAPGRLARSEDRNGNALDFEYDGSGRLARIRDTLDHAGNPRVMTLGYRSDGRLGAVVDFTGRVVRYDYCGASDPAGPEGTLKSVTTPRVVGTPNGNDFPQGKTTTYTCTNGFADARLNGNLLTITDPLGQVVLSNVYAATANPRDVRFDRVERQVLGSSPGAIDYVYLRQAPSASNGGTILRCIVNDRVGNVRERFYDALHRMVIEREFTGRANPTLPTDATTNRPANPLRPGDPSFFETIYEFDADSLLKQVVRPEGDVTLQVHEVDLDPAAPRRARGNLRERHRLPGPRGADQAEIVELYEYAAGMGGCCGLNFVTRDTDGRGNVTLHDYDARGNRVRAVHRIPSIVEEWQYDANGQVVAHLLPTDANGQRRRDERAYYGVADGVQNGFLKTEVVDAAGLALTTTWEYDALGNVVRMIDPAGADTLLVLNALNQVVRVSSPEVPAGSGVRYRVDRYFDAADRLVQVDRLNVEADGGVGKNAAFSHWLTYDDLGRLITESKEIDAARFAATRHAYDGNGNRVSTLLPEATAGRQPDNALAFEWDERDLLFKSVRGAGGATPSTTQLDYDGNRNVVRRREGLEAGPRTTTLGYDGFDRRVSTKDAMGNVVTTSYDACANVVRKQTSGENVDVPGDLGNVMIADHHWNWDPMNRPLQEFEIWIDPAGLPVGDGRKDTICAWSDSSQLVQITDDHGHATLYSYDGAGRWIGGTDSAGDELQRILDANGRRLRHVQSLVSAAGARTFVHQWRRDPLGRVVKRIDAAGHEQSYAWDSRDLVGSSVDERGNETLLTYDGLSRLVRSETTLTSDGTGGGAPVGSIVTQQQWDDASRLLARIDANGNATSFAYDGLGRVLQVVFADGTSESCAWNARDDLVTKLDANGTLLDLANDKLGRRKKLQVTPGAGVSPQTTFAEWTWDGLSRPVRARDDDSDVTLAYDSLSNLLQEVQNGVAVSTTRDALGNLLALDEPGGRRLEYAYDAVERLVEVRDGGAPLVTWSWLGSQPERIDRAGGLVSRFDYDAELLSSRVTHEFEGKGPPSVLWDRQLAHDATRHRTLEVDLTTGASRAWSFDSAGRMIQSRLTDRFGNVQTIDYLLDAAGNRRQVLGGPRAGAYLLDPTLPAPADAQVNQYTTTPFDARSYDGAGNLVTAIGAQQLRQCTWDFAHQLVEEVDPATGNRVTYAYDALGRRFQKIVTGAASQTVRYSWSRDQIIEERDAGGSTLASYVVAEDPVFFDLPAELLDRRSQTPVSFTRNGTLHHLLADDLGSTRVAAMSNGQVLESCDYDDFGVVSFFDVSGAPFPTSRIGNPIVFRGMRLESWDGVETLQGTSMLYDASAGRAVQRDPAFANSPQDPPPPGFQCGQHYLWWMQHGRGKQDAVPRPKRSAVDEFLNPGGVPSSPKRGNPLLFGFEMGGWETLFGKPVPRAQKDCCCVTWRGDEPPEDAQGYYGYDVRNVTTDSPLSCDAVCAKFGYKLGYDGKCRFSKTQELLKMLFEW